MTFSRRWAKQKKDQAERKAEKPKRELLSDQNATLEVFEEVKSKGRPLNRRSK